MGWQSEARPFKQACAQAFMSAVKLLPTGARINSAAQKALEQNERRRWRAYDTMLGKLKDVVVDHSQTIQLLLCLNRVGLRFDDVGRVTVSYIA